MASKGRTQERMEWGTIEKMAIKMAKEWGSQRELWTERMGYREGEGMARRAKRQGATKTTGMYVRQIPAASTNDAKNYSRNTAESGIL